MSYITNPEEAEARLEQGDVITPYYHNAYKKGVQEADDLSGLTKSKWAWEVTGMGSEAVVYGPKNGDSETRSEGFVIDLVYYDGSQEIKLAWTIHSDGWMLLRPREADDTHFRWNVPDTVSVREGNHE